MAAVTLLAPPSVPGLSARSKWGLDAKGKTDTHWTTDIETLRREKLFRNPPKDRSAYPTLQASIRPHVDSFNAIFDAQDEGKSLMQHAIEDIGVKTFLEPTGKAPAGADRSALNTADRLYVKLDRVVLDRPFAPSSKLQSSSKGEETWPATCRERHASYRGKLRVAYSFKVNDGEWNEGSRELGALPIMLRSNRCHLEGLPPAELVRRKEESEELGGYFIVNGNEKLIRMLVVGKSNYPMAIVRGSFVNRGDNYSKFGIQIRCVRPDMTSQTNVLHYLTDGNVTFRFSWRKNEYLVPVMMILKALVETSDREIFEALVGVAKSKGADNTFVLERVELLLRTYKGYGLHGKTQTRSYLGGKFKHVLDLPIDTSDEVAGAEFLRKVVLVHLGNIDVDEAQDEDKFNMLLLMIRKLYSLVAGDCTQDNPDAVSNQDALLGGFLYSMIIKEKLEDWLGGIRTALSRWINRKDFHPFRHPKFVQAFRTVGITQHPAAVGQAMEYFLSTGNLTSTSGLDLQQVSGFTVVAEKINFYRFLSHFRMVHRGSFFAQLRTTTVRKLLPESWGFLCPVHTPDGSPCGLLNHFAHKCILTTKHLDVSSLESLLARMGLKGLPSASVQESVPVVLDGRVLGYCGPVHAKNLVDQLRLWKIDKNPKIPAELELGYVPNSNGGLYPGVFMSSKSARMIRAVKHVATGRTDYVGPFEQPFMSIACREHEIEPHETTHVEFDVKNILSIFANQTPFSDHNQSPRNMYQCQMAKQTMGTPGTTLKHRTDNKSYRLQTGQTPIVRPPLYNEYGLDNFPNGTNAVVAVISYTGYDMDDAMILNKSAHERGFGHGTMYKVKIIKLDESQRARSVKTVDQLFGFAPGAALAGRIREKLDDDGLPRVGAKVEEGDPLCCSHSVAWDPKLGWINRDSKNVFHKYKDAETAFVEEVRLIGPDSGDAPCQAISIKLRIPRSPIIGDKFSSRHGQKGVCSQKWPTIDMPFSESGMVPDIIINPHAFPSRMTIGMFIESLAGKAGALHGFAQDSSPWRFDDDNPAGEYFGEQLRAAGFNFHGNEPMYSGITGREFAADIYLGLVFYQRLRHMVNDKFQVRTTGTVNPLTNQPIKGRSKGGGIRIGEMERDALLAHGAAYLLQDRLLNCSDYTKAWVCKQCGSFLSTQAAMPRTSGRGKVKSAIFRCRRCATRAQSNTPKALTWEDGAGNVFTGGENTTVIAVPGVLRYLDVELQAMGIQMKFTVGP